MTRKKMQTVKARYGKTMTQGSKNKQVKPTMKVQPKKNGFKVKIKF